MYIIYSYILFLCVIQKYFFSFKWVEEKRKLGESCGPCNCVPNKHGIRTAGECDDGLVCKRLPTDYVDSAGRCVRKGMLEH